MQPKKVLLATHEEYTPRHETLLNTLFERRIELFCAWGKHCEQWELAMDLFVTDPVRFDESRHITTTSHPGESFEEVLNMAELWSVDNGSDEVEVVRL